MFVASTTDLRRSGDQIFLKFSYLFQRSILSELVLTIREIAKTREWALAPAEGMRFIPFLHPVIGINK